MHEDNIESLWRKVMNTSADNCPMAFAKALVERAVLAEREACANVCKERAANHASEIRESEADACAASILARSNAVAQRAA